LQRGLSARALSDQAGLSPSYVSKVESGLEPSLKAFARIADVLDLNIHEIRFLMRLTVQKGSDESTPEPTQGMDRVQFAGPSQ
jgi:transcriptional regulator with XRE-family HTH domain